MKNKNILTNEDLEMLEAYMDFSHANSPSLRNVLTEDAIVNDWIFRQRVVSNGDSRCENCGNLILGGTAVTFIRGVRRSHVLCEECRNNVIGYLIKNLWSKQ